MCIEQTPKVTTLTVLRFQTETYAYLVDLQRWGKSVFNVSNNYSKLMWKKKQLENDAENFIIHECIYSNNLDDESWRANCDFYQTSPNFNLLDVFVVLWV